MAVLLAVTPTCQLPGRLVTDTFRNKIVQTQDTKGPITSATDQKFVNPFFNQFNPAFGQFGFNPFLGNTVYGSGFGYGYPPNQQMDNSLQEDVDDLKADVREIRQQLYGISQALIGLGGTTVPAPPPATTPTAGSILGTRCASCHGANLATPKGGLFIAPGVPLAPAKAKLAGLRATNGEMPPNGPQLTPEEITQLKSELLDLVQ
jgi:hypothetical protein